MEEVTRKRIVRLLDALPDDQLYQVMDYIEFIAAKYAAEAARPTDPFQRFVERVEDQMRVRSLAPKAMKSTMKIMSTAGKMIDGVKDLGNALVSPIATPAATSNEPRTAPAPGKPSAGRPEDGGKSGGEGA